MKRLSWLLSLLLGLSLLFTGCDRGRQSSKTAQSPATKPSTSTMSDSDLEKAVRTQLNNDEQLKEANLSVNANAERNEITLSGTVRSQAAREKAVELAKNAKPGVLVNDKIDVKPAG
jgi:hyperosmotically inducible periplasmic protein